jgi:hypothetical protein
MDKLRAAAFVILALMRNLWKLLLACIPSSWRISPDPARRERFLKLVIVLAICLSAGPELYAALELQILLELLGATLFTVAFIAGAKLALLNLVDNLRRVWLPVAPAALMILAYAEWWLASTAAFIASAQALWKGFV